MSRTIKITKQNPLNIPVGSVLHSHTISNEPSDPFANNKWEQTDYYIWKNLDGELKTVLSKDVYSLLKECYVNCIRLTWKSKFLYEGDEYWKVFTFENIARYHKLEFKDGKHHPAELLKPYKDIVHSNTNTDMFGYQRFETLEEAQDYCYKIKNNIPIW